MSLQLSWPENFPISSFRQKHGMIFSRSHSREGRGGSSIPEFFDIVPSSSALSLDVFFGCNFSFCQKILKNWLYNFLFE